METTSGCARCSLPNPHASRLTNSGVSLPSLVGTGNNLMEPMRSGAPPSSTLMCAVAAQITAPQRGNNACKPTTFAPVPLKTGYAVAVEPKCFTMTSSSNAVYSSAPYAAWCPPRAVVNAASTSGATPEYLSEAKLCATGTCRGFTKSPSAMPGAAKHGTPPPSGGVAKCLENHVQQSWSQRELVGVHAVIWELVECERGEHEPANPRKRELPYVIPVIFSLFCFLPR